MLPRWFLDVGFQIVFFQITLILETDIVTFVPNTNHLACLVPPLWHPGGPWDDPGAPGGLKKGDLGVQAWMTESTL